MNSRAKKGGLKGLSGIGSDMRELEVKAAADMHAAEAIDVFCYQISKFIGAYFAVLGGWICWFSRAASARIPRALRR